MIAPESPGPRATGWLRFGDNWRLRLEFKPADLWIGVFVRRERVLKATFYDLWICLLPMVPLHLSWDRPADRPFRARS